MHYNYVNHMPEGNIIYNQAMIVNLMFGPQFWASRPKDASFAHFAVFFFCKLFNKNTNQQKSILKFKVLQLNLSCWKTGLEMI